MEIWKTITEPEYQKNYQVSSFGRVKSLYRNERILKPANRGEYLGVQLNNNGKGKTFCIHRLVALAFIPNPENKPVVNHIDSDKHNNILSNLEWCSYSYNRKHAETSKSFIPKTQKVLQYNSSGELINTFNSVKDAMLSTNVGDSKICSVCKGTRKSAGGFVWQYNDNSNLPVADVPDGKQIEEFPRYIVTKDGRIYSKSAKKYISSRLNSGYQYVTLYNNKTRKDFSIHYLVAKAFIENPNNLPMVNHKNSIRNDNNIDNLEWCSYSDNMYHAGVKNFVSVIKLSKDGIFLEEYKSISEAAKDNNTNVSGIINTCKGKSKTSGGYKWQYKNDKSRTC